MTSLKEELIKISEEVVDKEELMAARKRDFKLAKREVIFPKPPLWVWVLHLFMHCFRKSFT